MFQFKIPAPVLGTFYEGHFDTFLQRIEKKGDGQIHDDENQPTVVASGLGKCSVWPDYRCSSKTEQHRHKSMFHRCSKSILKEPTFECAICNKTLLSQSSLNRHKLKEGQNRHAIVNTDEPPQRRCKTKQCMINEMLPNHQDRIKVKEIDNDDTCSVTNCQINLGRKAVINWICCEECDRWYHSVCVGLEDKSEIDINNMDYTCCSVFL